MVSRLLDLVVLVVELTQESDKSFKDLDKELEHRGYSPDEIDQAMFWMSSKFNPLDGGANMYTDAGARLLSPWETHALSSESHGYLLRLLNLGVLDVEQFERILSRVHPFGGERMQLSDIKVLVGVAIFNLGGFEFDEEPFNLLDEEPPTT